MRKKTQVKNLMRVNANEEGEMQKLLKNFRQQFCQ